MFPLDRESTYIQCMTPARIVTDIALLMCPLLGAGLLFGCAATAESIAWSRMLARQPLIVSVHRDSSASAWLRAEQWLRRNGGAGAVTVRSDRIDTRPDPESSSRRWYSVARTDDGDTVRFEIDFEIGVREPIDIVAASGVSTSARELALYLERGTTYESFTSIHHPDSSELLAALELAQQRPHRVWIGLGEGSFGFSFEAGMRNDWWGFSYGAADFDGPYDVVPHFDSADGRPVAPYVTEPFAGLFSGLTAYGFLDVAPGSSLFGGLGLYVRTITELEREEATGQYFQQGAGVTWSDPALALSGGVQFSIAQRLVLGVGYGTVNGLHGQLGWRW